MGPSGASFKWGEATVASRLGRTQTFLLFRFSRHLLLALPRLSRAGCGSMKLFSSGPEIDEAEDAAARPETSSALAPAVDAAAEVDEKR